MQCPITDDTPALPTLHNLTQLKLSADGESGWNLLFDFIECSPKLGVLTFTVHWDFMITFQAITLTLFSLYIVLLIFDRAYILFLHQRNSLPGSAKNWSRPLGMPYCLVLHLEEIEINRINGEGYKLEAMEYLLKNAKVLKKMMIDCWHSSKTEGFCRWEKLIGIQRRGSTNCQLNLIF